jgi:hypothetical protein
MKANNYNRLGIPIVEVDPLVLPTISSHSSNGSSTPNELSELQQAIRNNAASSRANYPMWRMANRVSSNNAIPQTAILSFMRASDKPSNYLAYDVETLGRSTNPKENAFVTEVAYSLYDNVSIDQLKNDPWGTAREKRGILPR